MALRLYYATPFVNTYEVDKVDTYTGDGTTTTFTLLNKTTSNLGGTIQFDLNYYVRGLGGFTTPTTTTFTTSSAPPLNSQGVAPGVTTYTFNLFDQLNVPGWPQQPSNVDEEPFWLIDSDPVSIVTNKYEAVPSNPGIAIFIQNMVTAAGAQTTWMQLACADAAGNALTYQATGTTLYTSNILAFSLLSASASAASTNILQLLANTATAFSAGDYIFVNPSFSTGEITQITGFIGDGLVTTGFNYNHYGGEGVYACGRKFWGKCTMPVGVLTGVANNFYNLGVGINLIKVSRL